MYEKTQFSHKIAEKTEENSLNFSNQIQSTQRHLSNSVFIWFHPPILISNCQFSYRYFVRNTSNTWTRKMKEEKKERREEKSGMRSRTNTKLENIIKSSWTLINDMNWGGRMRKRERIIIFMHITWTQKRERGRRREEVKYEREDFLFKWC